MQRVGVGGRGAKPWRQQQLRAHMKSYDQEAETIHQENTPEVSELTQTHQREQRFKKPTGPFSSEPLLQFFSKLLH